MLARLQNTCKCCVYCCWSNWGTRCKGSALFWIKGAEINISFAFKETTQTQKVLFFFASIQQGAFNTVVTHILFSERLVHLRGAHISFSLVCIVDDWAWKVLKSYKRSYSLYTIRFVLIMNITLSIICTE